VDRVDAPGQSRSDGVAKINGDALIVEHAALNREFMDRAEVRLLEHAIDHAAATAAAEDHRIRTFQNFDTVDVVEIAIILNVVANAVDEEIGVGTLPANDDVVAVAFTLMGDHTRNVADRVA